MPGAATLAVPSMPRRGSTGAVPAAAAPAPLQRRTSDAALLTVPGAPRRVSSVLVPRSGTGDVPDAPADGATAASVMAQAPRRLPRHSSDGTNQDLELSILAVEAKLEQSATRPPLERRAVTKQELADGRAIMNEARALHVSGKEYEADRKQLEKEYVAARTLVADVEAQRETVMEDNKKLKTDILALQDKLKDAEGELATRRRLVVVQERRCKDLQAEKTALEKEIEKLLEEVDVLKDNLGIQETNVDRLKELAERLQEDIAKAQKRQEEMQEQHRLQILVMESEIAKDVDELNEEYSHKEEELRRLLRESADMRQKAEQDWAEREARLAKMAKEEVRAKNDELQNLRAKIEVLLREQIDTMRTRVRQQSEPHAALAKARTPQSTAAARVSDRVRRQQQGRAPRDLAVHTHEVLGELSAGRKILTLALSSRSGDFHPPVSWAGSGPVHHGDVSAEDVAVQVSVDQRVLRPIPTSARPDTTHLSAALRSSGLARGAQAQADEWRFATPMGTEIVVGVTLLPPGVG
eukprot:TRINITY_DN22399_c0_g1_i1.p1 TRINITY_DN22399_c0_g1~~TRINITY_DN22399_c0_g1_i1.p1  ORF type:complete len:525 (+),score=240.66 TRINITY_DN22399_c0_g1_i1:61-1635(+)